MKSFIQKNIRVMSSERNTNSVIVNSKGDGIDYDGVIDGNVVEEIVYCKVCNKELKCDFDLNEIVEHIKEQHNDQIN